MIFFNLQSIQYQGDFLDTVTNDFHYIHTGSKSRSFFQHSLKKANLKEFIFEIEKASGYSFIYGEEIIFKHPITLSLRKAPLSLILQKAFAGQNISFKINKNHIILKKIRSTIQQEVFYPKRVCIGQYIERNIDRCQYL